MKLLALLLVCTACAACQRTAPPAGPPLVPADLEAMLGGLAGGAPEDIARAVAGWQLDEDAWQHTVVPSYRGLYADYVRAFAAATPALVAQLARGGEIHARRHWALDPRLTPAQARDRWAVPVMYPSAVAELGGVALPVVFVPDGEHWRALAGLDEALLARVRATAPDPACADRLAAAGGKPGHCGDAGWMIADAALRGDAPGLRRACELAVAMCATP